MQQIFRAICSERRPIMLEIKDFFTPNILIIGVGGGGNNAIMRMMANPSGQATYVAVNTDLQALEDSPAEVKIQIGRKLTNGFGAGADPSIGEAAAKESEDELIAATANADMVILTCGMGGGTGTGATPVIAKLCKERGILTMAIVTEPFNFESSPRTIAAKAGIAELQKYVDTLIVIPNDKLLTISDKPFKLSAAFTMADSVLKHTIEGVSNIIFNKGMINLDFNDLKTTLLDKGKAHLGIGSTKGNSSLMDAVNQAINSPLLDTTIKGASHILFNSSGDVDILELNQAVSYIRELAGNNVNIIWGTVAPKDSADGEVVVTIIATGIEDSNSTQPVAKPAEFTAKPLKPITNSQNIATPSRPTNAKLMDIQIPPFLSKYSK